VIVRITIGRGIRNYHGAVALTPEGPVIAPGDAGNPKDRRGRQMQGTFAFIVVSARLLIRFSYEIGVNAWRDCDQLSSLFAVMCREITSDTFDGCVSGPMWPAPAMIFSRL
jgi:hypothetical protein